MTPRPGGASPTLSAGFARSRAELLDSLEGTLYAEQTDGRERPGEVTDSVVEELGAVHGTFDTGDGDENGDGVGDGDQNGDGPGDGDQNGDPGTADDSGPGFGVVVVVAAVVALVGARRQR